MFAIVAMTFAACSSDDDRDNPIVQQLIGSWQPISNCSSCGQSNTFETWYKDLTWDKHAIVDGNTELVRKGDFGCKENILHLRSVCPKGHDLKEIDFKVDKAGIIHTSIGKVSMTAEQICGNAKEFISTVIKLKPAAAKGTYIKSIFISSTMSKGVKIDPKSAE